MSSVLHPWQAHKAMFSETWPGAVATQSPHSRHTVAMATAASAASAAIDHVHDWVLGTAEGDWVSMAIPSDGSYGVEKGFISSFPCAHRDGDARDVA